MNYEEILTRALRIAWRHKYLWLLALFAGEGVGLGMTGLPRSSGRPSAGHRAAMPASAASWSQVGAWMSGHAWLLAGAGLAAALVLIVFVLVSAVANSALVRAAAEHDDERPFELRQAWRAGVSTFRPMLRLKVTAALVYLGALAVIGSSVLAAVSAGMAHAVGLAVAAALVAGLLVLAAIPTLAVFQVAVLLAARAIVLDGRRTADALRAGFALIRRRLGRVALVWLLVGVVSIVLGVAVWIALAVVAVPLAGVVIAGYLAGGIPVAGVVAAVLGLTWLLVALGLLAGVSAYTSIAWTLAYRRFDLEPVPTSSPSPAPA